MRRRATTSPKPSWRSTRTARSSALRVKTVAAIGAYLQNNMPAFITQCRHARRRLSDARDPRRRHRRVHQHQSGAALSRQWPPRSRLRHRTHGRSGRRRTRASIRPNCAGATTSRRSKCRSRPGSRSPTTAASSKRTWTWRWSSPISHGFEQRARGVAQARQAARLRHFQHHRARRCRRHRRRRSALRPRRHGDLVLRHRSPHGQGHETVFKQLVCDRLGVHPDEVRYVQGDTDEVFYGEGTGGSRSATMGGAAFTMATDKVIDKGQGDRRPCAQGRRGGREIRRWRVLLAEDQPHDDHQGSRHRRVESGQAAGVMEPGLSATAVYKRREAKFPERLPYLRIRNRQGNRRGRNRALQRGRRRRHRAQSDAAARPDPRRRRAGRRPGADGRHPFRCQRPAGDRLVHGLRHAARP